MGLLSSLAFVLTVWHLSAERNGSRIFAYARCFWPQGRAVYIALAGLPITLLAAVTLLALQARYDTNDVSRAWAAPLPFGVFDGKHGVSSLHWAFSIVGLGVGVLETLLLAVVVVAVARGMELRLRSVAVAAAVMAFIALLSPEMSTGDPYEFVAAGLLHNAAYAPIRDAFVGTIYESVNHVIPMGGVIYGPLWLFIDGLATSLGSSLVDKIEALRVMNVLLLLVLILILRACNVGRASIVAIAVNPAVWFYVVVSPHADIEAFTLLGAAFFLVRRKLVFAAIIAVAAAGTIKLPFAIIGGLMLAPIPGAMRRLFCWGAAILISAGVSYAMTGHAYAHDLTTFTTVEAAGAPLWIWVPNVVIIAVALVVSILCKRGIGGVALLFNQIGPVATPWYFFWGAPYAFTGGVGASYLVVMPLFTTLADDLFELTIFTKCLLILIAQIAIIDQVLLRPRRSKIAAVELS